MDHGEKSYRRYLDGDNDGLIRGLLHLLRGINGRNV